MKKILHFKDNIINQFFKTTKMETKFNGLTENEVIESRKKYGKNVLTPPPSTPWWKLYLEKFKDPIIIILIVAAVISLGIGIMENSFIESIGIIVAIALATGVGFAMEYSAKKKFDILNQVSDTEPVKVRRNGKVIEIPKDELVVGDIVLISAGDEVPADIELLESTDIKVDESTMTGESVAVKKRAKNDGENYEGSGFPEYLLLRSTNITEGSGVGIVVKVGDSTEIGKTTRQAMEETELETPLNKQLNGLANLVSRAAFTIAGLLLLFLNVHHFGFTEFDSSSIGIIMAEIGFFMMAVALIICAIPEGLPLASTLSLAFSMKAMAKDNNLVKKLHASETIGCVNVICTDKTGTLTQNKMKVVDEAVKSYYKVIINGAINSTANIDYDTNKVIGNPTEGAILGWITPERIFQNSGENTLGNGYKSIREVVKVVEQLPFNSTNKYMSTKASDGVLYVKGAPEVISRLCGDDSYLEEVGKQQERGRRAISFASGSDMEHLEYDGTLFIEDPVRPDVPEAVKKAYKAGVDVVMMTGDNIKTASEIARQAGFKDVEAIEAKDWKGVGSDNWEDNIGGSSRRFPNVIARCKPEDKLRILKELQQKGMVCAMTGDGVNDSPSLNHADVGIAMGSGTSVAKEASDIVLLDDAFPSIILGIKWGRSLYKNIQNFLVFQLIINVAVCLTVLFSPLLGVDMPFTVTQMLWVNIVMDTLASCSISSEPADENVLNDRPRKSSAFIITKPMYKTILGFGIAIFILLSIIVHDIAQGSAWFGLDLTELFAVFMVINWWNIFNIRVFGKNRSIFHDIFNNKMFVWGSIIMLLGTILIVQFGGEVFSTRPLDFKEWCIILAATSPIVIIREIWWRLTHK